MCQYSEVTETNEPCCPQLTVAAAEPTDNAALADAFKALGDPVRLRMFSIICATPEGVCVCDLTSHFTLRQPTISHHLKLLHNAGVLTREKRGSWVYYSPDRARLETLSALLKP